MRGDIISKRGQASSVNYVGVSPLLKFGLVALSKGQAKEREETLESLSAYEYKVPSSSLFLARGIRRVEETERGLIYYPNVHFVVKDVSTLPPTTLTNSSNFGVHDDPSNLRIDFSNAPFLAQPRITSYSVEPSGNVAGTVYYRVSFIDANGKETLTSNEVVVSGLSNNSVRLYFNAEPYAKYVVIYKKAEGGDWQKVSIEQYNPANSPNGNDFSTYFSQGSFLDNGATDITWASVSEFPTVFQGKKIPDTSLAGNEVHAVFWENDLSALEVKEYYRVDDVEVEHGYESEVANIVRVLFAQGLSSVVISPVPYKKIDEETSSITTPSYNDFVEAVDKLDGEDVMFFGTTYYDSNLMQYCLNKAELLSDKDNIQRERYFVYAVKGVEPLDETEADTLLAIARATNSNGKRIVLGLVDGGVATVNSWVDWDVSNLTDTRVYSLVNSVDITPLILTFAAIARYVAFNDPAESLTQKVINGFKLPGQKSAVLLKRYTEQGFMVFTSDSKVAPPYVDTAWLPSIIVSLEDGDLAIAVTEDVLDRELRSFLVRWRGKKALDKILNAIASQLRRYVLDEFVKREWIMEYDPQSIQVFRDPNNPTRVRGKFRYRPMYSIRQIWVEHEFVV